MMCDGCGDVGRDPVRVCSFVLCPTCARVFPLIEKRLWRERIVYWFAMTVIFTVVGIVAWRACTW